MFAKWPKDEKRKLIANTFALLSAVALYLIVTNYTYVSAWLSKATSIFMPFIIAFAFAYLLNAPANFLEKEFKALKSARFWAVCMVFLIVGIAATAFSIAVMPIVVDSAVQVFSNMQEYTKNLTGFINDTLNYFNIDVSQAQAVLGSWEDIAALITDFASKMLPEVLNLSVALGRMLLNTLVALVAGFYMLLYKDNFKRQIKKAAFALMPSKQADRFFDIAANSHATFSGFINGKIIDSLIIGVMCFIGMIIFKMPFPALISLIVGITNVIPFFGPFFGAIPSIFIILMVAPVQALWFALFILLLQQFDGNILGPKILGDSIGLSPIWVLVAIIVGGGLFGLTGMFVGVPTFAVLYKLTSEYLRNRLKEKGIDETGAALTPPDIEKQKAESHNE